MAEAIKPYYTSNDIIEAIKRSISFPVAQNTFTTDDILRMVNEEMLVDQVPSVLSYHEEYYVFSQQVKLETNKSRYPIPNRAVGMRLRDLMYRDDGDNYYEMTRINATDKAHFQRSSTSTSGIAKFYIEGNDVVLTPTVTSNPSGYLVFYYYIRPNQLVDNSRAAICEKIEHVVSLPSKSFMSADVDIINDLITINSHGFQDGWKVVFSSTDSLPAPLSVDTKYFVVNSTTNTFQLSTTYGGSAIDLTSIGTGIHSLVRTMTFDIEFTTDQFDLTNNRIVVDHEYSNNTKVMLSTTGKLPNELSSNRIYYVIGVTDSSSFQLSLQENGSPIDLQSIGTGLHTISADLSVITCTEDIPVNITNSSVVDFLQTEGGHIILGIDKVLPDNSISADTLTVKTNDIPDNFVIGDYICLAKESIIPFLPSDLHYGLAERACARILSSINDKDGLAINQAKMQRIERSEERLLDNRVEGSPEKINNRHSLLRYGRIGHRRRF